MDMDIILASNIRNILRNAGKNRDALAEFLGYSNQTATAAM